MRRQMRTAVSALLVAAVLWGAAAARAATAVRIEGNAAISTRHLREAAADELAGLEEPARRPAAAEDAAFQMKHAGRRAGYAFIEVEHAITGEGADTAVVFRIREGPLVKLGEVSFSGNAFFTAAQLRPHIALESATNYVEADVRTGRNELVLRYREQGFSDVKIGEPQIALRSDRSVADVRFEIAEGTRFVISRVVFEGDELPNPSPALTGLESGLPGQPFFGRRRLAHRQARR